VSEGPNEFRIPTEPKDWITKSRIQSYKTCKRQYYYFAIKQLTYTATGPMLEGRKFHYSSSKFYRVVDIREKPTFEYYRSLLPLDKDVNGLYDNFAHFEVDRMLEIIKSHLDPAIYFLPILNEATIRLPEQKMSGHIDRCWLMREGQGFNAVVMEIKKGKITSKTSLRRETSFYVYLISQTELKDYIGIVPGYLGAYSPLNNEYWFEKLATKTWNTLFTTLDEMTFDLLTFGEDEEKWPKNQFVDCTYCPYERLCWL